MPVTYYCENIKFSLQNKRAVSAWIRYCITKEAHKLGDVSIVFCDDNFLLEINKKYLNHDYFTDIITFDYGEGSDKISGDLIISLDCVSRNAVKYEVTTEQELDRVMIHGILHLLGYDDQTDEEKAIMRSKEDFYCSVRNNEF